MIYIVTRHDAAAKWIAQQLGKKCGRIVHCQHMGAEQTELLTEQDSVLGILPLNIAGMVCMRGAEFYSLQMRVPESWRGKEMTLEEMKRCDPRLVRYFIAEIDVSAHRAFRLGKLTDAKAYLAKALNDVTNLVTFYRKKSHGQDTADEG